MFEYVSNILDPAKYMPHGGCYYWEPGLVWLHVISDSLIGLAYLSIPVFMWYFVKKKKGIPFNWMFISFAVFIFACGSTHLVEVWNVWHSAYWFSGGVKVITALSSVFTAAALVYVVPEALKLKTPAELETLNHALEKEIKERESAEKKLQKAYDELEMRVKQRTQELSDINKNLIREIEERKKTAEALNESEKKFRLALENSPISVFHQDKELKFTWVYNPDKSIVKDSVIGKTDYDILPKEDADFLTGIKRKVLKDGVHYNNEVEIQNNNSPKYYNLTVEPLKSENGEIIGIGCSTVDITGRIIAEKKQQNLLDISNQRLAELDAVIQSIPDAVYIGDATGIKKANKLAVEMLGFNSVEELNNKIDNLSHQIFTRYADTGEKIPPQKEGFNLALQGIHCIREVIVNDLKTNKDKILRSSSAPIKLGNKIIGAVTINTDITKDKENEREQKRLLELERKTRIEAEDTKTRLSYLAEASHILGSTLDYYETLSNLANLLTPELADWCAINILEEDGNVKQVAVSHINPEKVKWALELNQKYPPDPDQSTGVYNVIRTGISEFYPVIPEELLKKAAKNEDHRKILNEIGFTSAMVVPLKIRDKVLGTITLVSAESGYNYTEFDLKFAEDLASRAAIFVENSRNYFALQKLNEKLEERVKERTADLESFSYSVSHDLRAPLRVIDRFSEVVLNNYSGKLDDNGKKYLDIVRSNTVRMEELIEALLTFSRLGQKELQKSDINIEEIVRSVVDDENKISDNKIKEVLIEEIYNAKGDKKLIKQVFSNLIANAYKFTKNKPDAKIRIGSFQKDNEVIYFINDNGEGFDMRYADKLFGVFQRLHNTEEFEGTGVGLAIVHKIIQKHGGKVWAESSVNNGTTFYFSLPV